MSVRRKIRRRPFVTVPPSNGPAFAGPIGLEVWSTATASGIGQPIWRSGLMDSGTDIEMRLDRQASETRRPVSLGSGTALPLDGDRRQNFGLARQSGSSLLKDQLDLSITEIAVVWILHYGMLPRGLVRSLTSDIVDFYPAALRTILRVEALRSAKQSELRLIYFKGLIVSLTHPKSEMVEAVRRADHSLETGAVSSERSEPSQRQSTTRPASDDHDTLAHIADALGSFYGSAR